MYRIIAELTPNNQLKVTKLGKWNRYKREDSTDVRNTEKHAEAYSLAFDYWQIESRLEELTTFDAWDDEAGCEVPHVTIFDERTGTSTDVPKYRVIDEVERYETLLDLLSESQSSDSSHNSWGKYRQPSAFSKRGRHKILEAGGAVEKKGKQDECLLLTVTIPGGGREVYDAVARWSGYICNLMTQQLRNYDRGNEGKEERGFFYVWELQKRGALHLHWCLVGYPESVAIACKDAWYRALYTIGGEEMINLFESDRGKDWSNHPQFWQWDIQKTKKSVAGYFAKYVSKTAGAANATPPNDWGQAGYTTTPGRWYNMSYSIRTWIKQMSCRIDITVPDENCMGAFLHEIRLCMDAMRLYGCTSYPVEITNDGGYLLASGEVESYLVSPDDYSLLLQRVEVMKLVCQDIPLENRISGIDPIIYQDVVLYSQLIRAAGKHRRKDKDWEDIE